MNTELKQALIEFIDETERVLENHKKELLFCNSMLLGMTLEIKKLGGLDKAMDVFQKMRDSAEAEYKKETPKKRESFDKLRELLKD